jgi:hypothetical protein
MSSRRWTLRLVACAVGACAVLTGCSDAQQARETLPPVTSAPPSEETLPPLGPEDMPMPAEARTQDAAGAEAFVRYYIDLINRTSTVMDAQPLRDLSDGCRDCDRIAEIVDSDRAAGLKRVGGLITVTGFGQPEVDDSGSQMAIVVDQAPLQVLDGSGLPVAGRGSSAYTGLSGGAALAWDPDQSNWVMTNLTFG